jgi:hypothetical protein
MNQDELNKSAGEKLAALDTAGVVVEFTIDEALLIGAFEEDAISFEVAIEAANDERSL